LKSVDQLAKKAMGLTPTERIRLVEAILYSLDKPDPEIEKSWIAESEARYAAYKRGELEAIDWEEIKGVQIFWNNAPNGLRIPDQRGFPREEHLPESHREHGFIIPEGYKPLAGG
jgi:putative addiction module component (TIGR02574 family)